MKQTTFKIENTSTVFTIVSVMAIEDTSINIEYSDSIINFDLHKGVNAIVVGKNKTAKLVMNTDICWVMTTNTRHLTEIDGPIQHIAGDDLSSTLAGCYGLTKVSEDIFEKNTDKVKMTKTFRDCVDFVLDEDNSKMFKYLPKVRILKDTFANNGNKFISSNALPLEATHIVLDGTFRNNVYLESISNKAFANIDCIDLRQTFEECTSLGSIHKDFFLNIKPLNTLIEVFKNSGITAVDENILTYIPSGTVYKDVFYGCNCKINKDFK